MSKLRKSGSHHWINQKLSAIVLIPLVIWLIFQINSIFININNIGALITNPINITLFVMFIMVAFYHAALGLQVIYEDYIHCKCARMFLSLLTHFIIVFTLIITLFAIITVHFL
jgi:succinate dehydrogenase / fumarate reductase, membrane anchor subunit